MHLCTQLAPVLGPVCPTALIGTSLFTLHKLLFGVWSLVAMADQNVRKAAPAASGPLKKSLKWKPTPGSMLDFAMQEHAQQKAAKSVKTGSVKTKAAMPTPNPMATGASLPSDSEPSSLSVPKDTSATLPSTSMETGAEQRTTPLNAEPDTWQPMNLDEPDEQPHADACATAMSNHDNELLSLAVLKVLQDYEVKRHEANKKILRELEHELRSATKEAF